MRLDKRTAGAALRAREGPGGGTELLRTGQKSLSRYYPRGHEPSAPVAMEGR